ncbi:class I SAM-dependent methyltransferase, partial [Chloroflexota bacterium]
GSGRDLRYFGRKGFNVIGLDYAVKLSKLAKGFSEQPVTVADLNFPPFRRHSFDAVWAIGSLLHIHRQSISHVLARIHRILRVEGVLLTSIKKGQGENIDVHGRYTVFYQPQDWGDFFSSNGFDVIQIEETKEIRQIKPNQQQEIWWITCLAKAV